MPVNTGHAIGQYARFVFRPNESLNELLTGTAIGGSVGTTENIGGKLAYVPTSSDTKWTFAEDELDPAVSGAFTVFWHGYLRDNVIQCLYGTFSSGQTYGVQFGTYQYAPGWILLYAYSQFQGNFRQSNPVPVTDNTLHTVAMRYTGTTVEFFLDGVSLGAPVAWQKDTTVVGAGQYFMLGGQATPNKTFTTQAFVGALSDSDITTLHNDPYAIFSAPAAQLTIANATQGNTASTGTIGVVGVFYAAPCVQSNTVSTGSITRTQTLTVANATQGNAVSKGSISPLARLKDILQGIPLNTWVKVNTDRFLDCTFPRSDDNPLYTATTHEAVVKPWSGFAFDRIHGEIIFWGGGHANYLGNEIYQWNAETGGWRIGSLPSLVDSEGYIVDKAAPQSSHTYVNNIYLENQNFFCTFGGAAAPSGSAFRERTGTSPTTERRVGPWTFDMTLSDGTKVGGTTGSGWDTTNVKLGSSAWYNRRDKSSGYPIDTLNNVDGGAVYVNEGGTDVAYVTMDSASGFPSWYKYTFGDIRSGGTDTCAKIGVTTAGISYVNFAFYDPSRQWMFINGIGEVYNASYPAEMLGLHLPSANGSTAATPFRIRDEAGNPLAMIRGTSGNYLYFGGVYDHLNDCIWLYSGHQTDDPNGVIYRVPMPAWSLGSGWATTNLTAYRVIPASGYIPRGGYGTSSILGKIKYVKELGCLIVMDAIDAVNNLDPDVLLFKTTQFTNDLTVGTTTQGNAVAGVVATQAHNLTVSSGTQGNAASAVAISRTLDLIVSGAAQSNTASSAGISQVGSLAVASATQANTAATASIAQTHNLAVAGLTQGNVAETPAVIVSHDLAVVSASQVNTPSDGTVSQIHGLAASSLSQSNEAEAAAIVVGVLVSLDVSSLDQGNQAASGSVSQTHVLTTDSCAQANAAESPSIGGTVFLAIAASSQTNSSSSVSITQVYILEVSPATQGNSSSVGAITSGNPFAAAPCQQENVAGSGAIVQIHNLAVFTIIQSNTFAGARIVLPDLLAVDPRYIVYSHAKKYTVIYGDK